MTEFRTRFAPSPTGPLHLGHAASARYVRNAADAAGGEALLRIEDTDLTRCRPEFEQAILDDLSWLGLKWDGDVRRQSQHLDDYQRVVVELRERGLVYRCFLTRQEVLARFPDGIVRAPSLSKTEELDRFSRGDAFAWRLSLDAAKLEMGVLLYSALSYQIDQDGALETLTADPAQHGDIALTRKDSPAAYHLAACHDDALQQITHVVRGEDLVGAPHIHTLLQALMDWPRPVYRHHPLVLDENEEKLSKRTGGKSLASLRDDGLTPSEIWRLAGVA
ncbi:MAG: tRNA glutamyl-Q(34) synthetase GluQRS [Pseudomonadota bacterium]